MSIKIKKPFYFVEFVDGVYSLRNNDDVILFRSRSIYDILDVLVIYCEIRDYKRIQFTGLMPEVLQFTKDVYSALV